MDKKIEHLVAFINRRCCELGFHYWSIRLQNLGLQAKDPWVAVTCMKLTTIGTKITSAAAVNVQEYIDGEVDDAQVDARMHAAHVAMENCFLNEKVIQAENPIGKGVTCWQMAYGS